MAATPACNGDALLQIEKVGRRFAGRVALEDVTFSVRPRLVTGLIGRSVAGKSTLINAITGVVPPSSGRVLIYGHNTASMAVRPGAL